MAQHFKTIVDSEWGGGGGVIKMLPPHGAWLIRVTRGEADRT